MGNALGQLFTDIAASIRGGLGDIEKMKPNSFPDKIDEIVALIGSGSGGSGEGGTNTTVEYASGSFNTADVGVGRQYITHNLGVKPDMVAVFMTAHDTIDGSKNPLLMVMGFTKRIDVGGSWQQSLMYYNHSTSSLDIDTEQPAISFASNAIYCDSVNSFRVGTDHQYSEEEPRQFVENAMYKWVAISGLLGGATNVVDAVIEPLTVTENGTYVPPEGVDGYSPVTVNVPDPTKIIVMQEQTISGFAMDSDFGAYSPGFANPAQYVLKAGETYFVDWDGEQYECTAVSFDFSGMEMIFIGNGTSFGYPGNGEPFAMAYNASLDNSQIFSTDAAESHTVGIWQRVVQEIKLQDKTITENGAYTADTGFDGLGKVTVDVAGSGGGSLPAGAYWEEDEAGMPNDYPQRLFMHNGVLHCFTLAAYTGGGKNGYLFKRENGTWVKVRDLTNSYDPLSCVDAIEFNEKTHFFGYYEKHWVYDGQGEIQKLNDIPGSANTYYFRSFVQDGKLKFLDHTTHDVLVWDEASDTWSVESSKVTGTTKEYTLGVFTGDEKVYIYHEQSGKGIISVYENNILTKLCDVNVRFSIKDNTVFEGKYVYGTAADPNKKYTAVAKLNIKTGEVALLGRMPSEKYDYTVNMRSPDRVRIYGVIWTGTGTVAARKNLVLHEVTE